MELNKIEILIEKYFQGETSLAEEKELRSYFSSPDVAPHLEQYKAMFGYFTEAKQQQFTKEIPPVKSNNKVMWISIAASIVVLFGVVTFFTNNMALQESQNELGSYETPEEAFRETQKALALLSENVNTGMESVSYLQEYENAKNKVFKNN